MDLTETITSFASAHPALIGIVIFLSAAAEAIVVVGAVVPGSGIIIILAGFVGAARGEMWPLIAWAAAGAFLSDSAAYLIGRHYGDRFKGIWPFSKRPDLIDKAAAFFARHGGKSIVIGRFIPGLKSVLPLAAGVVGMKPSYFFAACFASGIVFAVVHVVPAAVFGAVLASVGHISSRLIGAVLGLIVLLGLAIYAARLAVIVISPRLVAAYESGIAHLARSDRPFLRRIGELLDPAVANLRAHVLWGLVLLASTIGIAGIARDLVDGEPLVQADAAIRQFFQSVRTPPLDEFAVVVSAFGDGIVILLAVTLMLAALLLYRAPKSAALVATVFVATVVFVPLMQSLVRQQRPAFALPGFESFSFPSPHATSVALFLGVIVVLVSPTLSATWRVATWATGFLLAAIVGLSRIYLNTQWPSDVFAGLLLGLALTAIFALVEKDFENEVEHRLWAPAIAFAGFLAVGAGKASVGFDADLVRYQPKTEIQTMTEADWLSAGWRLLPERRADFFGGTEEPFFLQIAADPETLAPILASAGWQKAKPFAATDLVFFLVPAAPLDSFPPLPLMHGGRLPEASFVHPTADPGKRLVVRLWPSDFALHKDRDVPILLGSVTEERVLHPYEALTTLSEHPASAQELLEAREAFAKTGTPPLRVERKNTASGPILLITRE